MTGGRERAIRLAGLWLAAAGTAVLWAVIIAAVAATIAQGG